MNSLQLRLQVGLVLAGGLRHEEMALTLTVAEDIAPLLQQVQQYDLVFALFAFAALLLMVLLQHWLVRRSLAQLDPLYRDIARLEAGQISRLTETVPDEILPLVREFNRLLALFAQRLTRSRTAAGNLGHALKGTLTLLRQQLQDPGLDLPAPARAGLLAQTERLAVVMERQLQRARLAGGRGAALRFDPAAELPTLIRLLERIHAERGLAH